MKMKGVRFYSLKGEVLEPNATAELQSMCDMLRYDFAFIRRDQPSILACPTLTSRTGTYNGKVTYDRWDTFGVRIEANGVGAAQWEEAHESITKHPEQWFTCAHPRDEFGGGADYDKLMWLPLSMVLAHGTLIEAVRAQCEIDEVVQATK